MSFRVDSEHIFALSKSGIVWDGQASCLLTYTVIQLPGEYHVVWTEIQVYLRANDLPPHVVER